MSQRTRWAVQIVTAVVFGVVAHLQASSSTAYVSICCSAPSTAGVFNAATLALTRTIATGSGGDGLALTPDGTKMFVTVDHRGELQAIATATGALLARIKVPIGIAGTPPLELAMNPDGRHVYVFVPQIQPKSLLIAVDTTTYRVTGRLNLPFNESEGPLLVSPDGTKLYFEEGLVNQYIQVIDTATLKPVTQIVVNEAPTGLAVTPSGLLLMPDTNNELLVIDPRAGAIVNRISLGPPGQILAGPVISSPDSATAYLAFAGPSILAVSLATGATVFNAPVVQLPTHFALSPDGKALYSINFSTEGAYSVSEFSIPAQKPAATVRQLGPLSAVALSQDGGTLYVLNADQSAIVPVDVSSRKPGHGILGGVGINSLAIPANGGTVWGSSYAFALSGNILIWNPATGRLQFTAGASGGLSFSPSGTVLYVASPSKVIAVDVRTLHETARYTAAQLTNVGQAIPSPDGQRVYISVTFVSGSPDGAVLLPPGDLEVLDSATLKRIAAINIPDGVGALALTPDGTTLLCTSNRGHVHLISTATGKITATIGLSPSNGLLQGLAVSPDGSLAYVTDAENNLLFVADLATQTQQAAFPVGMAPLGVAITPDGSAAWVLTTPGLETVNVLTGNVGGPVPLPGAPSAIVFAP